MEPCRECGAPCRVEVFGPNPAIEQPVSLWVCSNHQRFGGDCPSDLAYFNVEAWNTRPTADLGEDLAAMLYQEAGQLDDLDRANAIRQAADRLILYREALVAARPYVEANASRDSRMTAHHKGADVLDKIDAVLSRSGG